MTWTKLSDDYTDDCWTLSDAAFRLHTEALVWSNRKLLDCVIPKADLVRFSRRAEAAGELLAHGWWTEDGDTYVIRHQAIYQRSKAEVLRQQAINKSNGSKGGRPPKTRPSVPREVFNGAAKTHSLTETVTESLSEPLTEWVSETESQSEPLTETETERDRTGQDRKPKGSELSDPLCEHELTTPTQREHGMCNRCFTVAKADQSWKAS